MLQHLIRSALVYFRAIEKPDFYTKWLSRHPSPEKIKPNVVVIVGNSKFQKWACFKCPDGCGETILLSLSQSRRPRWTVTADWMGRPTIHPSIRQLDGCKSHFWVKQGKVKWCSDSSGLRH